MSYTASRNYRTASVLRDRLYASEANQDVLDYLNGCYNMVEYPHYVDIVWLEQYEALNHGDRKQFLEGHTSFVRLMARIYVNRPYRSSTGSRDEMTLSEVVQEAVKQRRVLKWMLQNEALCKGIGAWEHRPFPESFTCLGVDGATTAQRFAEFYRTVHVPERVWLSSCQVSQSDAAAIALTPNYNRLPSWVRQGLMNAPSSAKIGGDRIGDIWRLISCVKAWKWAALPKRVAEKIGKLSPKTRMLSAIAWSATDEHATEYEDGTPYNRVDHFYSELAWLSKQPLITQCQEALSRTSWGQTRWEAFLCESLGLPFGALDLPKAVNMDAIEEVILDCGSPRQVCQNLLGVTGKATVKAFQSSSKVNWKWAGAIAFGNPDAVQKILGMDTIIDYEPEAVEFLLSLPMVSRLRLLQSTEFKYRGQVSPVSNDHVRDTGYLWKNIQNKPELGRVRCWFSVHEALAAEFVKELPDESLPIPTGWEKVDGLCSVDGSWELEFPKRVNTLKYYGKLLNNCVGGYGPAIKSGRSVIFVVREYGQITHCVEVSGGCVNQFYQYGNREGDRALEESVTAALKQAKLL